MCLCLLRLDDKRRQRWTHTLPRLSGDRWGTWGKSKSKKKKSNANFIVMMIPSVVVFLVHHKRWLVRLFQCTLSVHRMLFSSVFVVSWKCDVLMGISFVRYTIELTMVYCETVGEAFFYCDVIETKHDARCSLFSVIDDSGEGPKDELMYRLHVRFIFGEKRCASQFISTNTAST